MGTSKRLQPGGVEPSTGFQGGSHGNDGSARARQSLAWHVGQSASSSDDSLVISVIPEPHFGHGWGFGTVFHATPEVPALQGPIRKGAQDIKPVRKGQ